MCSCQTKIETTEIRDYYTQISQKETYDTTLKIQFYSL